METKNLDYLWRVIDCYGTMLDQINEEGKGRKLTEVDALKRPYTFYLIPQKSNLPKVSVRIDGTKRFIYFRRTNKKVSMMGNLFRGEQFVSMRYVLGWQDTINGKNIRSMLWINPKTGEIKEKDER